MAGLRFDKTLIKKLFREDIMKESVIYQEIFETGEQQGLQREKAYIIRQIVRKVGEMPQELRSTIELLSFAQRLRIGESIN
jgi:predicted transposase YdaD